MSERSKADKQRRVRNWARRKSQRMGLVPRDFLTDHLRFVLDSLPSSLPWNELDPQMAPPERSPKKK